jgi:hypothetical protein
VSEISAILMLFVSSNFQCWVDGTCCHDHRERSAISFSFLILPSRLMPCEITSPEYFSRGLCRHFRKLRLPPPKPLELQLFPSDLAAFPSGVYGTRITFGKALHFISSFRN